ncbi:zinc carboxypeptidase A 1 precursor [Moelleriella libera RCEF 2490]|uniref:Zinc carboxypeptidase A 1 n=1 Tax=Moelleriella libera RCEF 2490 TaxID=1081109 RepID=A0A168EKH2_9HYPO|nr:zinc carboxypeptidase A 1 precursor [Moelleriella libera RCEF 2490]
MKLQTALTILAFACASNGCLLPHEIDEIEGRATAAPRLSIRQAGQKFNKKWVPVGSADRFKGGATVPQGIGSKPQDFDNASKLSMLNVKEIKSGLDGLVKAYGNKIKVQSSAEKTVENRDIWYGVVGGHDKPRVFLTSGVHPRERGGPDNVLYFVSDLLWANKENKPLKYGKKTYSVEDVRKALDVGIAIIPAVNPDGIEHDQKTDSAWRKNRRPTKGGNFGVDINRNFQSLWDYKRLFAKDTAKMSDDPAQGTYVGPAALSEPETRAVANVFNKVNSLTWFMDIHSVMGAFLYGWGSALEQHSEPGMNFKNTTWDGKRGYRSSGYKEYIEEDDFKAQVSISEQMVNTIGVAAGQSGRYRSIPTVSLYPALGSTDDAMAKYYNGTCGANRINAVTFEFGRSGYRRGTPEQEIFYPDANEYMDNVMHTAVAMMEFVLNAAGEAGKEKTYKCDGKKPDEQQQQPQQPPQECKQDDTPRQKLDDLCKEKVIAALKDCQKRQPNANFQVCRDEVMPVVQRCQADPKKEVCGQGQDQPQPQPPKPEQPQRPSTPKPQQPQRPNAPNKPEEPKPTEPKPAECKVDKEKTAEITRQCRRKASDWYAQNCDRDNDPSFECRQRAQAVADQCKKDEASKLCPPQQQQQQQQKPEPKPESKPEPKPEQPPPPPPAAECKLDEQKTKDIDKSCGNMVREFHKENCIRNRDFSKECEQKSTAQYDQCKKDEASKVCQQQPQQQQQQQQQQQPQRPSAPRPEPQPEAKPEPAECNLDEQKTREINKQCVDKATAWFKRNCNGNNDPGRRCFKRAQAYADRCEKDETSKVCAQQQ